ncbi:HAD family hydrolase [Brevundimonas subvibrioides]|uniref:Haloacid dehalogenase domain protein hydrolase n=1 Tax=Brevundimonas subvibrioides (strain ATCC 15264 / DSM 4735 / LMG 14903 / NBRC 16000 / CB 81) TaxID=633149 RepID=D9QNB3_BRESC|nr:HAD family hydrolase [Brevundimonas subvibrioides]ADL00314.1 Haloacid dehalogenase domain protein hydrolase [Brevundimonas subvibrioides ATCC 15264]
MPITTVGLDADDTLWHNETIFRLTQARFLDLLSAHADTATTEARLAEVERRNLRLYGYGIKGFTLSMIETAMELCDGEAPAPVVREILAAGREMIAHPVETLPGVDETVAALAERHRLVLITKGDLLDQERKLAASGLGELFAAVEIVSEKDRGTYDRVFARHGTGADEAVMVGNSMKSDVLPALEAGAFAVHIPYHITWAHELADAPDGHARYGTLDTIAALPAWIAERA